MSIRPSSIAIGTTWALLLLDAFRQGLELPASPLGEQFRFEDFAPLLLFPFAFFVVAAFFQRHKQFTWPFITQAIDVRYGEGTFAQFLKRLRPVTLFMVACLVLGGTGLVATHLSNKLAGAYILSGFFLSGGFGLLVALLLSIKFPPRLM